jgi:adenosylcobinamide-GDP ribazoletransferase
MPAWRIVPDWVAARLVELGLAGALLTRLPVGWLLRCGPIVAPGAAVWAYPVVGWVVGGIGSLVLAGGRLIGLPPMVAVVIALAAMVLATGALHEDGLADTADGFGGGRSRARKLEIMRDSRIGSFGVVALILSFALRGAAMQAIAPAGVIAAAVLGRASMVAVLTLLPPARPDGLAAGLGAMDAKRVAVAMGIAASSALLLLPFATALLAVAGTAVAALAMCWLARRQIGGHTGDVCGADEQATEGLTLMAMVLAG